MAENVLREEIADDDPRLRWSKVVKKIADALNKVTFLKEDYGDRPLMAPADWEPARTQGLGSLLDIDKIAEHLDLSARGFSPFKDKFPGISDRIPELQSKRKQGIAALTDYLPGPGPTEAKLAAGAAVGAVRKKGDIITPELAKKLAIKITRQPESSSRPLSEIASGDLLTDKLAKYLQSTAGTDSDPLKKLPMWMPPNRSFYPDAIDRGVPLLPPEVRGVEPAVPDFRMDVRPDMEMPSETVQASAIDDLIGKALAEGRSSTEKLKSLAPVKAMPDEELERINRIVSALGLRTNSISRAVANSRYDDNLRNLAEGSGIWQENLPKVIESLPEGAIVGKYPASSSYTGLETNLRHNYGSQKFAQFVDAIPQEKLKTMKFEDIAQQFAKNNEKAFNDWGLTARGPVIDSGVNPQGEWQLLDNENALLFQGISSDICVGQSGYCTAVRRGEQKIYGFRDKETQKPLLTINTKIKSTMDTTVPPGQDFAAAVMELRNSGNLTPDVVDRIQRSFATATGNSSWGRSLRELIDRGEDNPLVDYFNVFTSHDIASGINRNPERRAAAEALFAEFGKELPPTYGQQIQKEVMDQVKGRKNYVEDIPPELKGEAEAFIAKLEAQGVDTTQSSDWQRIKERMQTEGAQQRSESGLSEADLERIASIYEPEGQYGMNMFGRKWLVDPHSGAYTVDKGTTMYAGFDLDKEMPNLFDMSPLEGPGKVRTEYARAVKGATEPHESVKGEIIALKEMKEARMREAEAIVARAQPFETDYWQGRQFLRDGDTVYWLEYGDLKRGKLLDDGRIEGEIYIDDATMPIDARSAMKARLKVLRDNARIAQDTQMARAVPWEEELPNGNRVQMLTLDDGYVYWVNPETDRLMRAPSNEDDGILWDGAERAGNVIGNDLLNRIRRRLDPNY